MNSEQFIEINIIQKRFAQIINFFRAQNDKFWNMEPESEPPGARADSIWQKPTSDFQRRPTKWRLRNTRLFIPTSAG